jgi:hypothetical protein
MIAFNPFKQQPGQVLQGWQSCCKLLDTAGLWWANTIDLNEVQMPQACQCRQALQ